ncbi:hypothetical protein [uncultured Dysosmobacter sp.]|uniref:hypothetical protein n=1 Tax=uncultured Dysosmobacter sp. TaxID=2591384 RepID=UPI002610694F|nr:hypothetical protein [uncultured Dysosmobacter sp.]
MNTDYEFLAEKEAMWAEMLMQVLKKNDIPYTAIPVYGVGLVMKAGMQERLKIYVPSGEKARAEELLEELFSEGNE